MLSFWLVVPLVSHAQATGNTSIIQAEYYIDIDPGPGNGSPIALSFSDSIAVTFNASVAHLSPGYHELVIRSKDNAGRWSIAQSHLFFVNPLLTPVIPPPPPFTLVSAEYFFDNDPGAGNAQPIAFIAGDSTAIIRSISTAGVSAGQHTIGLRFKDLAGNWGHVKTYEVNLFQDTLGMNVPIANFSWGGSLVAGQPIQFTNTSSNLPANRRFQWDFGADGSVEYSSFHAQHTFAHPGIYDVLLRVINTGTEIDTSGLLGLYRFYNGARTNFHGPLGTLIREGGIQTVDGRQGNPNGAFSTENTSNISYLTAQRTPLNAQELSVSYWFKGSNARNVLNLLDAWNNGVFSPLNGNHYVAGRSVQAYGSAAEVNDGKWHHLAFTYLPNSSNGFKAYLDGQLRYESFTNSNTLSTLDSLVIGANSGVEAEGAFDDMYLFKRVLSPTEIFSLYTEAVSDVVVKQVEVGPLPSNLISGATVDTICSGDSLVLVAPPGSNHLWSTGESGQQIVVKSSGIYQCAYTDINGQSRSSNTQSITVHQTPEVLAHIAPATNGQANGSIALDLRGGSGQYTVNWSHGATGAILAGLTAGTYVATVSDNYCPKSYTFQVADGTIAPSNELLRAEAFFDQDPGIGNGIPLLVPNLHEVDVHLDIASSGLAAGEHFLHIRVQERNQRWSIVSRNLIYVQDTNQPVIHNPGPRGHIVEAEYFLDNDPGAGNGSVLPISSTDSVIDVNPSLIIAQGTPVGTHALGVRVKDSHGAWSIVYKSEIFVDVIPPANLPDFRLPLVEAEYFFDQNDPGAGQAIPLQIAISDSLLEQTFAVSLQGLSAGNHQVHVRVKDVTGQWAMVKSSSFAVDSSCVPPIADFQFGTASAGSALSVTNSSTNVSSLAMYYWDINADGTVDYTSQNIQHTFQQPGFYPIKLSVVNVDSCYAEVIKTVRVDPLPSSTPAVNGALTFCSGDTTYLIAPQGSHFIWNTLDTTRSIAVTQSGSYWASYRDALGLARQTDPIRITVYPSMDIQWSIIPEVNGMGNGGIRLFIQGGSSYKPEIIWSTGDTTTMITHRIAGTYSVSVNDGNCPQTFSITIPAQNVNPLEGIIAAEYFFGDLDPGPGMGLPLTVNPGHLSNTLSNISTSGLAPGIHRLYVRALQTDGLWSTVFGYRLVIVNDSAQLAPLGNTTIVAAEYFFDQDPGPGNAQAIPAFNPDSTIDVMALAQTHGLVVGPHRLGIRVKDSAGNWSMVSDQTIHIDRIPEVPAPAWPIVALEYFIGNTDPGFGNGTSIPIAIGDSLNILRALDVSSLLPGSYNVFVRAKDLSGLWSHLETFQLVILPANCVMPSADFVSTTAVAGQAISFINTSTNVLSNAQIEWDMNADGVTDYTVNNPTHTFNSPGIYEIRLRVSNGNGCVSEKVILQEVGPLPSSQLVLQGQKEFCDCDSLVLSASNGSSYLWSTGDTTNSIVIRQSGTYSVVITDSLGNHIQSESIQALVHPQPIINSFSSPAHNSLHDGTASVTAVQGGTGYLFSYLWSTGDSSRSISQLSPGTYWVAVSDGYCTSYDTLTVAHVTSNPLQGLVVAEYMFGDTDPGPGQGIPLAYGYGDSVLRAVTVATNGLAPGIHNLWFRVKESMGLWSAWKLRPITVSDTVTQPTLPDANITEVAFFIDNDNGPAYSTTIVGGLNAQSLDASYQVNMPSLTPGFHDFAIRVRDGNGNWSAVKTADINNCIPPSAPIAGNDLAVCLGSNVQLSSSYSGSDPVYWQGPNGMVYSGLQASVAIADTSFEGLYLVYAEGAGACRSLYDSLYVDIVQPIQEIGDITTNSLANCVSRDTINLFVTPQSEVTNYQWILPPGSLILAGNNTNSVTVDISSWTGSSALVQVVLSNACDQDTSRTLVLTRCSNVLPIVATSASYALSADSAFSGGIVVQAGATNLQRVGICISTQQQPTISDRIVDATVGLGAFHVFVDNLQAQTQYYVRAFAQNANGVSYGNQLNFTTEAVNNGCVNLNSSASIVGNYAVRFRWDATGAATYGIRLRKVGASAWQSFASNSNSRILQNREPGNYEYYIEDLTTGTQSCVQQFTVGCATDIVYTFNAFQAPEMGRYGRVRVFGTQGGKRLYDIYLVDSNGDSTAALNVRQRNFTDLQDQSYSIYVRDDFGCEAASVGQFIIESLDTGYVPRLIRAVNNPPNGFRPTWNSVSGIINYQLRVLNVTDGSLERFITGINDTSYAVTNLTPGKLYRFNVRSRYRLNGINRISGYSNAVSRNLPVSGNKGEQSGDEGTAEGTAINLSVYPNPTNGMLYIQAPEGSTLTLIDLNGKAIARRTVKDVEEMMDLTELAQGVYLLEVNNQGQLYRERIVKQ